MTQLQTECRLCYAGYTKHLLGQF